MGIVEFGEGLLVYGSEGIAYLHSIIEPVVTFGQHKIMSIGILDNSAYGGNAKEQLFIDSKKRMWRISADMKLSYLRYDNYVSALSGQLGITYNALNDEYYVSGNNESLLVTKYGVTRLPYPVASLLYRDGSNLIVR